MENSVPLLDDLVKKDEDLRVVQSGYFGSIIETHLDIGYDLEEEEPEEPLQISIPVRIVRHVLVINISIAFLYSVFGLVPYSLLERAPRAVPWALFGVSLASTLVCGFLMHRHRKHRVAAISLYVMWILITFVTVSSFAAALQNLAPFQGCTIFFIQCIVALLYCLYAGKDNVNPWWAAGLMLFAGLCVWAIGLYCFLNEQDWLTSGILFFVCVLFLPLYTSYEIHLIMKRYNLEELLLANIEFITDCITLVPPTLARCRSTDDSEVHPPDPQ